MAMRENRKAPPVLLADADSNNRVLIQSAWEKSEPPADLRMVPDNQKLMDYLRRRGRYATLRSAPEPGLVLLDNHTGGLEMLEEMKFSPSLQHIPVVVLAKSEELKNVGRFYALGAGGVIARPETYSEFVEMLKLLYTYWYHIVRLPGRECLPPRMCGAA